MRGANVSGLPVRSYQLVFANSSWSAAAPGCVMTWGGSTRSGRSSVKPSRPGDRELVGQIAPEARQPRDVDDGASGHVQQALMKERVGAHQHRPVDAAEAEPVVHDPRRIDEVGPDSGDVEASLEGAPEGHVVDDRLDEPRLEPVDRLPRGQLAAVRLNVTRRANAVVEAV